MSGVKSLFEFACNAFVRHVNLLCAYTELVPVVLFDFLLMASLKTDRILSTQYLFLSWPLQKLYLVGCEEFTEKHAVTLAHCLEHSACNKLQEVDLSGCNIGVQGTTMLLMFTAGRPMPLTEYCRNQETCTKFKLNDSKELPNRLSITMDCYVNDKNYSLFLDVLDGQCTLHDFTVSCFNAIELGYKHIRNAMRMFRDVQAQLVVGLDFKMNGLSMFELEPKLMKNEKLWYKFFHHFSNLQYLNLSMNLIGLHVIYLILKNVSAYLTHLLLNACTLMREAPSHFDEIAKLSCIRKLENLELRSNNLKQIAPGLMKFLQNCCGTLSFLNLENNCLSDDCLPFILQLLHEPFTLKTLHIRSNSLSLDAEKHMFRKDKVGIIKDYRYPKILLEN